MTYLHSDLTEKIIGLSFEVGRNLGYGLMEKDYAKAVCLELDECGLTYELEKTVDLTYKNSSLARKRLDILVEDRVVVELKVAEFISNTYVNQVVSYLKSTGLRVGLIICFAKNGVKIKRVIK